MPTARAAMHRLGEGIHVAQWPIVRDMHQVASRHYAFEGRTAVAAAGSFLTKGDVLFAPGDPHLPKLWSVIYMYLNKAGTVSA